MMKAEEDERPRSPLSSHLMGCHKQAGISKACVYTYICRTHKQGFFPSIIKWFLQDHRIFCHCFIYRNIKDFYFLLFICIVYDVATTVAIVIHVIQI